MHPAIIIGTFRSLIVDVAMGQIPRSTERISSYFLKFVSKFNLSFFFFRLFYYVMRTFYLRVIYVLRNLQPRMQHLQRHKQEIGCSDSD